LANKVKGEAKMYNTCEIDLDIHLFDSNLEREIMEMTCEELSSLEHRRSRPWLRLEEDIMIIDRLKKLQNVFEAAGFKTDIDIGYLTLKVLYVFPNKQYYKDSVKLKLDDEKDPIGAAMEDMYEILQKVEPVMNHLVNMYVEMEDDSNESNSAEH